MRVSKAAIPISPIILLAGFFLFSLMPFFSKLILPGYSPYDAKRIFELIILLFVNVCFLSFNVYRQSGVTIFESWQYKTKTIITIVFLIGVISSLLAHKINFSLLELSLYVQLFLFALFIASFYCTSQPLANQFLVFLILFPAVICLVRFIIALLFTHNWRIVTSIPFLNFMNPRFFAQYQIWTLPLVTLPLFFLKNRWLRGGIYLLSVFWILLAIVDGSKGMWLAFLMSMGIVFILLGRKAWGWFSLQLKVLLFAVLIIGLARFSFISQLFQKIKTLNLFQLFHGDIISRFSLWQHAFSLTRKHPFVGVGPMHFSCYFNGIAAHPHNSLLLIASEWGLPVLFLVLFLFIQGIRRWFSIKKEIINKEGLSKAIYIALSVSFLSGCLYSLMSGVVITPLSQIMLAIIMGWMVGIYASRQKVVQQDSMVIQLGFILLFVLSAAVIIMVALPFIKGLPAREIYWHFHHHLSIFYPRFWLQGWIR